MQIITSRNEEFKASRPGAIRECQGYSSSTLMMSASQSMGDGWSALG